VPYTLTLEVTMKLQLPNWLYLLSPYSHPDPDVREGRYYAACRAVGELLSAGLPVLSPIVQCHHAADICGLPGDAEFWQDYNARLMASCTGGILLLLEGWQESVGVHGEVTALMRDEKPVFACAPEDVPAFADYILGGNNKGRWMLTKWPVKQLKGALL